MAVPFDRIQMLELHLGVLHPGMSSESGTQAPRLANRDDLISAIVQQDDERGMNIFQIIDRGQGGKALLHGERQAAQRRLRLTCVLRSQQDMYGKTIRRETISVLKTRFIRLSKKSLFV
jgi:hypothetical protein